MIFYKIKKRIARLYYNIPRLRVYFKSAIKFKKPDKRSLQWWEERQNLGFDERTLWSLSSEIINFIYPRIKYYSEVAPFYIYEKSQEECKQIMNDMVYYFEQCYKHMNDMTPYEDEERMELGKKYFNEYFCRLGW